MSSRGTRAAAPPPRARGRCAPVRMSRRRSLDFSVWTQDEQLTSLSSERSAAARHPEKSSHICARVGKVKSSQVKEKTVSDACSEFPKLTRQGTGHPLGCGQLLFLVGSSLSLSTSPQDAVFQQRVPLASMLPKLYSVQLSCETKRMTQQHVWWRRPQPKHILKERLLPQWMLQRKQRSGERKR